MVDYIPSSLLNQDCCQSAKWEYDGTGYPGRLSHTEIPVGALVIAVADTFDTITTSRAYRSALSVEQAIAEIRRCSGTQFCPEVVAAFISGLEKKNISEIYLKVRNKKHELYQTQQIKSPFTVMCSF
jgi:HD-GYP domain-containing protein (c-di-GMP phosphodiesterase class II)